MTQLIAVYGTLKQGGSNRRVMEADNGSFVSKGTTVSKFTMFGGYGFPRVIYDGPETSNIHVEVFEVDNLDNMDRLEGHPNFFERKPITIQLEPPFPLEVGETGLVEAWMYFHPHLDANEHAEYIQTDGYWEARQDYR
jgi:gamma-glutamylcyclotransferase (GGCT)/AIG2-like uncharacterized protein YtfP